MRAWVMEESAVIEGIEEDKDRKDKSVLSFTQCGEASREAGLRHPTAEDSE